MTFEEAIKILAEERCKWCVFFDEEEQTCMADNGCFEATKIAIECIKKQMSKKQNKATNNNGEFIKFECPICKGFLIRNYPCKCGQRIDWEDE